MITPGEKSSARRRAQRGDMEVRVAETLFCQSVNIWCVDSGTKTTKMRKAQVVKQHHDHIWGLFTWVFVRRPSSLRLGNGTTNFSGKAFVIFHKY